MRDCGTRGVGSMIGLDTNVLVRYIMQDDAKQSANAYKLIESLSADKPGIIPLIAIVPTR
jgi:predicted nucleic-acid-binding protein